MTKGRLEAFSDGVLAIIITIMVLEMKVPHGSDFVALLLAFVSSWLALSLYVAVALLWLVPDRRVERSLAALQKDE